MLHGRVGEDDFRILEGIEEGPEAGVVLETGLLALGVGGGEIALDIYEALLEDQPLEGCAEAFRPFPPPGVRLLEGPAEIGRNEAVYPFENSHFHAAAFGIQRIVEVEHQGFCHWMKNTTDGAASSTRVLGAGLSQWSLPAVYTIFPCRGGLT